MSRKNSLLVGLLLVSAGPLSAQALNVNLTGRPAASLEEPFTTINGLQEVAPGKVVITDAQEQRLVFADLVANSVRNVATKGGGPGEWQMAISVFPGPGGTAYVPDIQLRRVHVINATGRIVSTVPFPGADPNADGVMTMAFPRGGDAQGRIFFTGAPFTPGQPAQPDSVPVLRWDPRIKRTDTIGMVKNEMQITQSGSAGNTRVMARVGGGVFSPQVVWLPLWDGRVAVVHPSPYRVDILEGAGRVRRGTAVPFTPVRIGKQERDEYRARAATQRPMQIRMGDGGGVTTSSSGAAAPPVPDSDFPAVMPPFAGGGIQISPNGEIWVLRNRPASDPTPTYDIWSSTGQLMGKATLKPHSAVVGFGAGSVYVARQDPEDDLRYLERYARN